MQPKPWQGLANGVLGIGRLASPWTLNYSDRVRASTSATVMEIVGLWLW